MKHVVREASTDILVLALLSTLIALWILSVLIGIVFFVGATA